MKSVPYKLFIFLSYILLKNVACAEEVKNYLEIKESLALVTNVKPTPQIEEIFFLVKGSLPKLGHLAELNEATIVSLFKLSYAFCAFAYRNELIMTIHNRWLYLGQPIEKNMANWSESEIELLLQDFGLQFYSRMLEAQEMVIFKNNILWLSKLAYSNELILNTTCAMFSSSPEFIAKR